MSANQLTDTQLVLLSAAAQHPEGAIELASDLKDGAAEKALSLVSDKTGDVRIYCITDKPAPAKRKGKPARKAG